MSKPQTQPNHYSPQREKRVADALRENLRKRKEQQQKQQPSPAVADAPAPSPCEQEEGGAPRSGEGEDHFKKEKLCP
jgi:hypothetical protein